VKIFCSALSKLATTALFSFLSATTLFAANWNPLPDTGQTQCYDVSGNVITCPAEGEPLYGQDANYQGAAPSYKDNGNGSVTDNNTGLIWQQGGQSSYYTWQNAVDYCDHLELAGISDWRLPTRMEFESIMNYSGSSHDNILGHISVTPYWTIDVYADDSTLAWNKYNGLSWAMEKSMTYLVRCVSGEVSSFGPYSGDQDTVIDDATGLTWQKQIADTNDDGFLSGNDAVTWKNALQFCEDLILGGSSDWRLPSIRELHSIVDLSKANPSSYDIFSEISSYDYTWSSTTDPHFADGSSDYYNRALSINISGNGKTDPVSKTNQELVRCVRGGLSPQNQNEITAQNYEFGNIDPRSDKFSVWMANVTINGETPTWQHFCGDYYISVEGDNGKGADMIGCGCVDCKDDKTPCGECLRYRIDFEIDKDKTYPTAAYFENGVIKFTDATTGTVSEVTGLDNFSVYGTTFDLEEDAWSFENTSWGMAKGDVEKYRKIIADEIDTAEGRTSSPDGTGGAGRETFNAHVGFQISSEEQTKSTGLCYGLATSAIANFTRKNISDSWGRGEVEDWKSKIDNHWDKEHNRAVYPFKPFRALLPSHPWAWRNVHDLTWGESAKMIMYYFASQDAYLNPRTTQNWVGKDVGMYKVPLNREEELSLANMLLKKGVPALFAFGTETGGGHAVTWVQLMRWNNRSKYMFWDNNYPYDSSKETGPYAEWKVFDRNGKYDSNCKSMMMLHQTKRHGDILYSFSNLDHIWILLPCQNNNREVQNIYNLWDEQTCLSAQDLQNDLTANSIPSQVPTSLTLYNTPNHLKIMFIGGTIDGIYNQATGNKISPVFTDTLQPGQAAIQSTMGGTYHLIYLPADTTYRVEATKSSDMPYAEVYATIPNTDGTADKLYYDNIGLSETDATGFYFLVGRSNSDRTLHRTGASDKAPDYDITLDMAITPPTEFTGIFNAGQVHLSWNNTDHPSLSLVKVLRSESGFPSSPTDGVEIYSGVGKNTADNTAQNNTLYYYAAFSMDNQGRYSESATAAVDTARFAVTGEVTNNGAGVSNAKIEIRDSEQFPVAMIYTGADGSYVLGNLENGSYSVEASATGYSIDNSPQTVTINNGNQVVDFTTTAVPSLNFVFDIDGLNLGSQAQISWKFQNIDSNETIIVQKIADSVVTQLAEVPISDNYILWNVDGFVDEEITLKILLKNDSSVSDTDSLKILPKVSVEKNPWTIFLPAILAGANKHKCYPNLPAPVIAQTDTDSFEGGDSTTYTRYNFTVVNNDQFPSSLFLPAPHLPPCGLNTEASRTWLDVYDNLDNRLYGFCGLEDLNSFNFSTPATEAPPAGIYIKVNDRQCNITYKSNVLTVQPAGQ